MCFYLLRYCPVLYSFSSPKYVGPNEGCVSRYEQIVLGLARSSEHWGLCHGNCGGHGPPAATPGSCQMYALVAPVSSNPAASEGHQPILCRQLHHTTASASPLSPNFGASSSEQNTEMSASGCLPTASVNPDLLPLFWA